MRPEARLFIIALVLILVGVGILASAVHAKPWGPTVEQDLALASQAWPDSPCAGHVQIVWWTDQQADHPTPQDLRRPDLTRVDESFDEYALGVKLLDDGSTFRSSCDLAVRRSLMVSDPAKLCDVIVHGAGHLAGLRHTHNGSIMDAEEGGIFPACHSLRDRIMRDVARLTGHDPFVACTGWRGAVMRCRAEYATGRWSWAHVARFRVRRAGETYTIRRVKGAR